MDQGPKTTQTTDNGPPPEPAVTGHDEPATSAKARPPTREKPPGHEADGIVAAAGTRLRDKVEADGRTRGSDSVPSAPVVVTAAAAK